MGIQTWIAKRREKKAQETTYSAPAPPSDSVKVITPSGDSGTNITYSPRSGGGGGSSGGGVGTPVASAVGGGVLTDTGKVIPQTQARQIQTQQQLRSKEIYNPKTGTYQKSAYGYGAGGTALERTPTYQEQIKIQQAHDRGDLGYQLTGTSSRDYKTIVGLQEEISKSSKELGKDIEKFEGKYSDLIKDSKFIGTKEEYEDYKEDYNKLNREQVKLEGKITQYTGKGGSISDKGYLEMPKVNIGGLNIRGKEVLKGKDVPISKFKNLYSFTGDPLVDVPRQLSAGVGFVGRAGGQIIGESFGKSLGGKKKYTLVEERLIPEKTLEGVYKPTYGTATSYNTLGMAQPTYEDVKVPARTRPELYFTGEQLGQATGDILGGVGEGSKYLVPYAGAAFFAGEVGGEIKESGGAKQYIKERPLEAALVGSVVLGAGVSKGVQYLKTAEASKISSQMLRLSERPLKYLEVIDKGKGQVKLRALQEYKGLQREISIVGKLGKTEKGFEFIPEAAGVATTTGKVKGLVGKKDIFRLDVFTTGTKGTSTPYRSIGDIKQYKTAGLSTYEPLGSTYALLRKRTKFAKVKKQFQKNIRLRGDVTKEIYTGDLFGLKENVFLGVKKDKEIGLTFIKKAKEVDKSMLISSTKIKGTPFSTTFAEEYKQLALVDRKIIKKGLAKQTQEVRPIGELDYLGTGKSTQIVEVEQRPTQLPMIKEQQLEDYRTMDIDVSKVRDVSWVGTKDRQETEQTSVSANIFEEATKERQEEVSKSILDTSQKPKQKETQRERQALRVRQLLKQKLQLKQAQESSQFFGAKEILKPTPKIPFKLEDAIKKVTKVAKEKPEVFEAFGRRFKKEVKLGIFETQQEAEKRLGKFLKRTLGAAGFLEKGGKKLKAEEIKLLEEPEFRKSKISEFLIVEKKEKRLRKAGTGKEIQFFRKEGGKKSKSLFGI